MLVLIYLASAVAVLQVVVRAIAGMRSVKSMGAKQDVFDRDVQLMYRGSFFSSHRY